MQASVYKDGIVTKLVETVPLVGYAAACLHVRSGNNEHSKRALAKCTSSTVTTAAMYTGFFFAGPLGAFVLGGLGAASGLKIEGLLSNNIQDQVVKSDCTNETPLDYFLAIAFGSISAGVGTGGAVVVKDILRELSWRGLKKGFVAAVSGKALSFIFADLPHGIAINSNNCCVKTTVKIQAFNQKILFSNSFDDIQFKSEWNSIGEVFTLIYIDVDRVVICNNYGNYISAISSYIECKSTTATEDCIFIINYHQDDCFSLESTYGYFCAYPSGDVGCCERQSNRSPCQFELFTIKSAN
ncbi:hypothetical protein HDV02_003944 [Globomyces sp. JEL0801]|nr:hypothetical protein HDV02_003944 [Globomyces sp. JEL0801]